MQSDGISKSDRDLNLVTVCCGFQPRLGLAGFDGKGNLGESLVLGPVDNNSSSTSLRMIRLPRNLQLVRILGLRHDDHAATPEVLPLSKNSAARPSM